MQKKKKNGEPQRYSWEGRRRRMVNPRDIAVNTEEEEESAAPCWARGSALLFSRPGIIVRNCSVAKAVARDESDFSLGGLRAVFVGSMLQIVAH